MNRACLCLSVAATLAALSPAYAQTAGPDPTTLPNLVIEGAGSTSLTQPNATDAALALDLVPGGVELVPETAYEDTPAYTLKDVLDYVPGVFVQPKWGQDARLSIRGSGLSRNFHLRGIALLQDGVPVNAADGGGDFQEIDPTAFRYVEVFKGANGLRYGAATLGGAINFVSPTGRDEQGVEGRVDVGSFGFYRLQASAGGVAGAVDGFVTSSWLSQDGFRDHSAGADFYGSGNVGVQIADNVETRFFLNVANIWQEIPGSVTKETALNDPKEANPANILQDYQRNVQSWRLSNKTAIVIENTLVEIGGYAVGKQLQHPIYQYLDYGYHDFGGFVRAINEGTLFGLPNRAVGGVQLAGGWVDNKQYVNGPGAKKGAKLSASTDSSLNVVVYGENNLEVAPGLSMILGLQYLYAEREREDEFSAAPDTSGSADYNMFNPKAGFIWSPDEDWQIFGNVSRSGEPPTFSELNFTNTALSDLKPQRATTIELGTRGTMGDFEWDLSLYRAWLKDEYQFFDLGGGNYQVTNADRTIHQGIELGASWSVVQNLFVEGEDADDIWLRGAYTFSDFYFDDDPTWGDNELPGAPRHYLRAELLYRHPSGFFAGPNVEWVPQAYYVDNANTLDTQPYALLGFRAGYDVGEHVSLYLDARNLTNEKYIASTSVVAVANPDSAVFEPGNGLGVYGGVRLQW